MYLTMIIIWNLYCFGHILFVLDRSGNKLICFLMFQGGVTPCHVASFHGQLDCLKVLIEANADVNKADKVSF